mgnify:CR=1 FL=1
MARPSVREDGCDVPEAEEANVMERKAAILKRIALHKTEMRKISEDTDAALVQYKAIVIQNGNDPLSQFYWVIGVAIFVCANYIQN